MSADVLHNFLLSFCVQKIQSKVQLASMKLHNNCENPSSNPLQEACFGSPIAASKSYSGSYL